MKNKRGFQTFWNMSSDITDPNVLNMFVYGRIMASSSFWFGSETDVVTSRFIKDLRKYPKATRINVYINSPGGDVFAAAAIKNQLQAHSAEVHSYIDGIAASAAVGLAMGANPGCIHMYNSALMMIHNPVVRIEGESKDLEKGATLLNKVKDTILNIYEERTGLSRDQLATMMDEETYFTASEALAQSFADTIVEGEDDLKVENFADEIIINDVPFAFNDTFQVMGNSVVFTNTISRDKLEAKLVEVKNKQPKNEQGGTIMSFEELLNAMPSEQRAIVEAHIQSISTTVASDTTTTLQQAWEEEKQTLQNTIENLKKTPSKISASVEDAELCNLPEEAKKLVIEARNATAAAKNQLAEMQKITALAAFKTTLLNDFNALPFEDAQIEALYTLSQKDKVNFNHIENLLKLSNNAMNAGFTVTGSDKGKNVSTTAADELESQIAAAQKENPKMSYQEALNKISTENPALYARYRDERG